MDVDARSEEGKLIVAPSERNHTLMTLVKQGVWDAGGKAGYHRGHPYEDEGGELVVEGDDPEATLADGIAAVRDELDAFRDAFDNA